MRFAVPQQLAGVLGALAIASAVQAQTPPGCTMGELPDPPRQVLTCQNGLVIEAEAAATLGLSADDPTEYVLEGGAVLITVQPGSTPIRIRTPHAIAAVRGTIFAVDAGAEATAVFVERGAVAVQAGDAEVTLNAGEGVNVRPGDPLEVNVWGADRVADLMARFAR